MEKVARIFRSFTEAGKAEREFYQSLTPEQRLEILFDLTSGAQPDEIKQGPERVYRIVKLQED